MNDVVIIGADRGIGAAMANVYHQRGDAVIAIDADLQHPPALIAPMLERWREGYDIVAAVRRDRAGQPHPARDRSGSGSP